MSFYRNRRDDNACVPLQAHSICRCRAPPGGRLRCGSRTVNPYCSSVPRPSWLQRTGNPRKTKAESRRVVRAGLSLQRFRYGQSPALEQLRLKPSGGVARLLKSLCLTPGCLSFKTLAGQVNRHLIVDDGCGRPDGHPEDTRTTVVSSRIPRQWLAWKRTFTFPIVAISC